MLRAPPSEMVSVLPVLVVSATKTTSLKNLKELPCTFSIPEPVESHDGKSRIGSAHEMDDVVSALFAGDEIG